MVWNTHASGTLDPPEVRNWRIHLIALVASMSALASMDLDSSLNQDDSRFSSGLRYGRYWGYYGTGLVYPRLRSRQGHQNTSGHSSREHSLHLSGMRLERMSWALTDASE